MQMSARVERDSCKVKRYFLMVWTAFVPVVQTFPFFECMALKCIFMSVQGYNRALTCCTQLDSFGQRFLTSA